MRGDARERGGGRARRLGDVKVGDGEPTMTGANPANPGPVGCYPGSFNPPTVAHLAIAEAAVRSGGLARLDLVLSRLALGKEDLAQPTVEERADVLRAVAATRPWLGVVVTEHRLIAEIAQGYDVVVLGADKWRQVIDPAWYDGDADARDQAVARLPRVLVAPRGDDRPEGVELLEVPDHHRHVSASAVRAGHPDAATWMLPEAAPLASQAGPADPGGWQRGHQ